MHKQLSIEVKSGATKLKGSKLEAIVLRTNLLVEAEASKCRGRVHKASLDLSRFIQKRLQWLGVLFSPV